MGRQWDRTRQGAKNVEERRCEGNDGRDNVEGLAIERVSWCIQKLRTLEQTLNYSVGVRGVRQALL